MRSTLKIRVAHAANFSFMSVSPDVCLVERDSYSFAALRESMLCRPKSAGSRCREQRRPGVLWNGPGRLRLPVCRWRPKVCGCRFWRLFACEAYVRVCGAGTARNGTASLEGADFGVELLVSQTKLLLCPSSHGADPADSQGAKCAKG